MPEIQNQSQKLVAKMWSIANNLRGNMDSSKFKDYILGMSIVYPNWYKL